MDLYRLSGTNEEFGPLDLENVLNNGMYLHSFCCFWLFDKSNTHGNNIYFYLLCGLIHLFFYIIFFWKKKVFV